MKQFWYSNCPARMREVRSGGCEAACSKFGAVVLIAGLAALASADGQSFSTTTAPVHSTPDAQLGKTPIALRNPASQSDSTPAEKQITWNLDRVPLAVFVSTLESELGRPISVDWAAMAEDGVTPETPMSIRLHGVPLRSAVSLALIPLGLISGWSDGQSLEITSALREFRPVERRYPVEDLLAGSGEAREQIADELWEIVQQYASPTSWSSVGGDGEITINTSDGTMAVSQSYAVHESVTQLLKMLRTGENPAPSGFESQILQALDQPISCDFEDMPLQVAVRHICGLGQIENILFNSQALQEEGVSLDTRVSLHVNHRPVHDALKQLLGSIGLWYLVEYDALVVTSQLEAGNNLFFRIVRIDDLLGRPPDVDALIRIIEN